MNLEQLVGSEAFDKIKGRSFGINPESRYSEKEFLERAEDMFKVAEYHKKINQNSGDMGALKGIMGIALKYMPGDNAKNAEILRDPFMAAEQARLLLDYGYRNMAGYAARNLDNLLSEMPEETLVEIAAMLPGKGKDYVQIAQYMQAGDMKSARKAYAETFKDKGLKKAILEFPHLKIIEEYMKIHINHGKKEFINRNLSMQAGEGKNKKYMLIPNRVKQYIARTISRYGDKEKPAHYIGIATALYNSKKGIEEKEEDTEELAMAA